MALTRCLQESLETILPVHDDLSLCVGVYMFRGQDNQDLLIKVLEKACQSGAGIMSFSAFQNVFNSALQGVKPVQPKRGDPSDHDATRKAMYSRAKYKVYLEWKYRKKINIYHARLKDYETQSMQVRSIVQNYRNTARGYIKYTFDSLSQADQVFFLQRHTFRINEWARQRHSYITGQSGSGKTELLKTLIHHYMTNDVNSAVILLDPHGDIAEQVAQFKENTGNDRLVYIDPFLSKDYTPIFNPFVIPRKAENHDIDLISEEIYMVFREILKSSFTAQMETLLRPCITTLLLMGGKDINDLQRFMDDDRNSHYLSFALKNLYNPSQVEFLKNDFHKDTYNPTKQAIKTKIQSLLNSNTFRNLLTGSPTFDLRQLTIERKLIIFNLSAGKMGGDTSDVVGRFLLAQIKSMAFQRASLPEHKRIRTHLFIDECQRYLSPAIKTILTEARKYKLHLTLANQYYGQDMTTALRDAITNNTMIKIAGKNGDKNSVIHHKETGANVDELKSLGVGHFHVKEGTKPSVKIKAPSNLVKNKNAMLSEEWEVKKMEIIEGYYQPLDGKEKEIDVDSAYSRKEAPQAIKKPVVKKEPDNKMTPKTTRIKPKMKIEL